MLTIKRITMRNFFSFGNAPQEVDLDRTDIALVLGQNNDATGDDPSGLRNGVGKSSIIQGIVFGLYGKSIGNEIKIPNLVNKTNNKYCEVFIDFIKDGVEYRVERGRNPAYFNFFKLSEDNEVVDESRGEKKDTQEDLTEILGISQMLFEHIVVLNANVEPFLSMSQQKQREMIEELLGITQLTEKANLLKDMYKDTKRDADQEKFRIDTISESNKRIEQSIESLQDQANVFESKKQQKIAAIEAELLDYSDVDFDNLIALANKNDEAVSFNKGRAELKDRLVILQKRQSEQENLFEKEREQTRLKIQELSSIDISVELDNHAQLEDWKTLDSILKQNMSTKASLEANIKNLERNKVQYSSALTREEAKLTDIINETCPLCKQDLPHSDNHEDIRGKTEAEILRLQEAVQKCDSDINETVAAISELEIFDMPEKPSTFYGTMAEATLHEHKLNELLKSLEAVRVNNYDVDVLEVVQALESSEDMEVISTFSTEEVQMLQYQFNTLNMDLEREKSSVNTYISQIETLKTNSIQAIDYDKYNDLAKLAEHQDFLAKLLMNKDSFVRKRIIDQNISFLNSRLQYYIEKIGSQQAVEFLNDLSVEITLNGQSYDFKQLSRGERTRVNIALSMAFRDTYESLYQGINLTCIDEQLDVGLDASGVVQSWNILKDFAVLRNKNVLVISHREELLSKAENIIKIVKEDGFSSVEFSTFDDLY